MTSSLLMLNAAANQQNPESTGAALARNMVDFFTIFPWWGMVLIVCGICWILRSAWGEVMSDGAFGMSPEDAERFNETLRVLFSGPAGPLLAFGMVLVVALLLTWIDTIAKGKK